MVAAGKKNASNPNAIASAPRSPTSHQLRARVSIRGSDGVTNGRDAALVVLMAWSFSSLRPNIAAPWRRRHQTFKCIFKLPRAAAFRVDAHQFARCFLSARIGLE